MADELGLDPVKDESTEIEEDESEEKDEDEPSEDESDDDEEDEEESDEEDSDGEEDDDEVEPSPLSETALAAKYPKLLKEFPELAPRLKLADEYEELFPTLEEAQAASRTLQGVANFEAAIEAGDVGTVLSNIGRAKPEALTQFVNNFLPTVFNADQATYTRITFPAVVATLQSQMEKARGNKNLEASINNTCYLIFGRKVHELPQVNLGAVKVEKRETPTRDPEKDPVLKQSRDNFVQVGMDKARTKLEPVVKSQFWDKLPLPPGTRTLFSQQLNTEVEKLVFEDEIYKAAYGRLYRSAESKGFPLNAVDKIVDLYVQRYQTLMVPVMRRLLKEANVKLDEGKGKDKKDGKGKKKLFGKKEKDTRTLDDKNKPPKNPTRAGDAAWLEKQLLAN